MKSREIVYTAIISRTTRQHEHTHSLFLEAFQTGERRSDYVKKKKKKKKLQTNVLIGEGLFKKSVVGV